MKGKTLLILLLAGFLITTLSPPVMAKTLVLKWASYQPPNNPFTTPQRWFMNEVERISNGKVKFKAYWAQSLVGAKEMMEAVRDGVADVVYPCPSYFRSKVPYSSLTDVAFLCTAGQGGRQDIVWSRVSLSPILTEEFDRWNAVYLFSGHVPPYNLMGKVPIRNIKDIEGKRIRALGGLGDLLKSFGGVPVFAPAPETFTALDRGVLDLAAGCGDYWHDAYKIDEASKYYTVGMDMSSAAGQALINKESYKKLPEEVKKAIPGLRKKIPYVSQTALAGAEKIKNWRAQFRGRGVEIIHFPPEERKKMKAAAGKFWEEWIAKWEKAGAKHAREALNLVKNMVAIVEKEYPQEMLDVPEEIRQKVVEIEANVKAGKGR
jgi:TRAP-type C4-dicarboxylate transport system substrate-binding protein